MPKSGLNRENNLHLTRLTVAASIFSPPTSASAAGPMAILAPKALLPRDASAIYAEVARFGFTSLQTVPGGVQIASEDGVSVLALTGTGWQFTEDLSQSGGFEPAISKIDVAIRAFLEKLPPNTVMLNQTVDLQATWENLGAQADEHIENRFLKPQARKIVSDIENLEFNGAGLRLNLTRPIGDLPPGVQPLPGGPPMVETFDVRVEPYFADKSKLFLEVTGVLAPTQDLSRVIQGARFVEKVLWEHVAGNIAMED